MITLMSRRITILCCVLGTALGLVLYKRYKQKRLRRALLQGILREAPATHNPIGAPHSSPMSATIVDSRGKQIRSADADLAEMHSLLMRMESALWSRYRSGDPELAPYSRYLEYLHERIGALQLREGFPGTITVTDGGSGKSVERRVSSYSLDKRVIVVCLRKGSDGDAATAFYKHNHSIFALVHELAHIACPCLDHPDEYHRIFERLLYEAIRYGVWSPEDYTRNPTMYCEVDLAHCPLGDDLRAEALRRPLELPPRELPKSSTGERFKHD
jgi:hypothetical protein